MSFIKNMQIKPENVKILHVLNKNEKAEVLESLLREHVLLPRQILSDKNQSTIIVPILLYDIIQIFLEFKSLLPSSNYEWE